MRIFNGRKLAGRCLPSLCRFAVSVQEDQRQAVCFVGNLIKHISMIAMQSLPVGDGRILLVIRSRSSDNRAAYQKATLFTDMQHIVFVRCAASCKQDA